MEILHSMSLNWSVEFTLDYLAAYTMITFQIYFLKWPCFQMGSSITVKKKDIDAYYLIYIILSMEETFILKIK